MRIALLTLLMAGLIAAPAQAGARDDAKRLVRVLDRFQVVMDREAKGVVEEYAGEVAGCAARAPEDAGAELRIGSLVVRAVLARRADQVDRTLARLTAFRSRERALVRVARAVRVTLGIAERLSLQAPRPCEYLETWAAAGWTRDFRFSPPLPNPTAEQVARMRRAARAVRRSSRRLRALGLSRGQVASVRSDWGDSSLYGSLGL